MNIKTFNSTIFIVFLMWILPVKAQLKLADIFSDNMVIQRDEPIKIWGNGPPGSNVEIEFLNIQKKTKTDSAGEWQIIFPGQNANLNPQQLRVSSSDESVLIKNILIGDIWLLLGQSNMEWPMRAEMHYENEIKEANNNLLRFYNPEYVGKNIYGQAYNEDQRQKLAEGVLYYNKKWKVSDTSSFAAMSAVGYYFAKQITSARNIPVGLINLSIGGAPLETFVSLEALKNNSRFSKKAQGNWLNNEHLPVWIRERGGENTNGQKTGYETSGPNHSYKPGFAYKAGIAPILKMPIKGILWYQGESNAQEIERVEEYPDLQKLMVQDYRRKWQQPDLPFYWVQLSSIDTLNYNSHYWPEFRDGQRRSLKEISHGGMAVSSDIGNKNDVHPRNKKDLGNRLARWALKGVYGEDIVVSGPLTLNAEYENGTVIVEFDHTAEGLKTGDGKTLKGFSVNEGKVKLKANIQNDQVVIKTPEKPEYIYYGWEPFSKGNLVNSEDLPASTFKLKVD